MNLDTLTAAGFIVLGMQGPSSAPAVFSAACDRAQDAGLGQLELVAAAVEYAPMMCRMLEAAYTVVGQNTGVAAYEVAQPFGEWFILFVLQNLGQVPGPRMSAKTIAALIYEFHIGHGRGADVNLPKLVQAIEEAVKEPA